MAITAALAALSHYETVTGIVQPLRKYDLVAVPGKDGAMENWGLLLFDDDRWADWSLMGRSIRREYYPKRCCCDEPRLRLATMKQ